MTDIENIYTQSQPRDATEFGYWMRQAAADYPSVRHQIIQAGIDAANAVADQGIGVYYEALRAAWRKIVEAIDEHRRDRCMNCDGSGMQESYEEFFPCPTCAPFADEME